MYVAITRAKNKLFLSRSKVKFNYESKKTEYTMPSRFLPEMFDDFKQKSSAVLKSNINENGFDSYLSQRARKQSLDEKMSSHANIVNVSGNINNSQSSAYESVSQAVKANDYSKFKKGTRVRHAHFGDGVVTLGVTDFASAFVTINFEKVGIKTLSLKYANLEIIE